MPRVSQSMCAALQEIARMKARPLRKQSQTQGPSTVRSSFCSPKEQLHRYNKPPQRRGMRPVE